MYQPIDICRINGVECDAISLGLVYVILNGKDMITNMFNQRLDKNGIGELYVLVDQSLYQACVSIFSKINRFIAVEYDRCRIPFADLVCSMVDNRSIKINTGMNEIYSVRMPHNVIYTDLICEDVICDLSDDDKMSVFCDKLIELFNELDIDDTSDESNSMIDVFSNTDESVFEY